MEFYGIGDGNLADCHSKSFHERDGVVVGAVGGAESGHGYSMYACPGQSENVECPCCHEDGERGVETAGNAYHDVAGVCGFKAFGESCRLDVDDFFASFVEQPVGGGHKRIWIDGAEQFIVVVFRDIYACRCGNGVFTHGTVAECGDVHSVALYSHDVDVGNLVGGFAEPSGRGADD